MKNTPLFFLLCAFLMASVHTQSQVDVQVDVVYSGGKTVRFPEVGVQLTIPNGWTGSLPTGETSFMLMDQSQTMSCAITIDYISYDELHASMNQRTALDDYTYLVPQGPSSKTGEILYNDIYLEASGQTFPAFGWAISREDGSCVYGYCFSQATIPQSAKDDMLGCARSVTFFEPEIDKAALAASGVSDWSSYMKGRHLRYLNTESGYSESEHIWLCSDGSFARSNNSNYSSSDAYTDFSYASGGGEQYGTWSVRGNVLTLRYEDGSTGTFQLELTDDTLYLNGYRYFRVENERCQ